MITDGSDFLLPTELTLGAGTEDDSITNTTINIVDDLVVEGRESFNISGVVASQCSLRLVVGMSAVTIIDNDCKWAC